MQVLINEIKLYKACNIKNYYHIQEKITYDTYISKIIKEGLQVQFSDAPVRDNWWKISYWTSECNNLNKETSKLLWRISFPSARKKDHFIPPVFNVDKKDDSYRMFLNLTKLN